MTTSLFRPEAIEAHRSKIWGEVTLSVPASLTMMTVFLAACVIGIGFFIGTGAYARKEHVPGFLAPKLGVANIVAPKTGTVAILHVKEGQMVEKGAPLITVNMEQSSEAGAGTDTGQLASLRQQKERLNDQIGLEHRRFDADSQRLTAEIDGLTSEIQSLQLELKVQAERTAVAKDQVNAIVDLTKRGVVSQFEYKKRQDNYLSFQQAELTLNRTIGEKQRDLGLRRGDLAQLPINSERQISQLQASISDLDMKIRQTDGQRAYLMTAPKRGRVSALQTWVGKVLETNLPQMSIVPDGDVLSAELLVPTRAIGFVAPGQTVHISYTSFPYQQFGFAEGTVENVSTTLLKPDQSVGPIQPSGPAYRVTVVLNRQTIPAYGKDVNWQADMQLEADIIFERRSLFAWLGEPLFASWRRPLLVVFWVSSGPAPGVFPTSARPKPPNADLPASR